MIEPKPIFVQRQDANFDRACDHANGMALVIFGIDEDGHSTKYPEYERSRDSIHVLFKSYKCMLGMTGADHIYTYMTWVERGDDEDPHY